MKITTVAEGFITRRQPGTPLSVAAGSRCVSRGNGELACSFMGQAAVGRNDFKPMLARSSNNGETWSEARVIWPELQERYSIFGSISGSPDGSLYFYGMRTPIDQPGEMAWSDASQGLKQNDLIWSRSVDFGQTWAPFTVIPMPIPGSAEAAGAMSITRRGDMVCCYAPCNTFDASLRVEKNQVIGLTSRDQGKTWRHNAMLRFSDAKSSGAESWVVELSNGRLLGTGWHILGDEPQTNKYAISNDAGATWCATQSTGIFGQSTALAPWADGRALFVYNQRKQGDIGVWLAVVDPTESNFGVVVNQRVWAAEIASQARATADFKDWTSFAFGEPSATVLSDGTILVTLWAMQPSGHGIRYVKLRLD